MKLDHGNIAIIGGTGFEQLPPEIFAEQIDVCTEHGVVSLLSVSHNYIEPDKLYFLSRHGASHGLAPHEINYRANIAALVELGVKSVFATNAVGSLRLDLPPSSLIIFDDFIDYTRARPLSYFSIGDSWKHTDFSVPYSLSLRLAMDQAASRLELPIVSKGTYLCCDGPRFESPAEIRMFRQWGADVVGMTGLPEAIFAREAGLEYAGLGIVTNFGAGLTEHLVEHNIHVDVMRTSINSVRELLMQASSILRESDFENANQ